MKRQSRFEAVHSDAGWFARFVASNGEEVWRTSEVYERKVDALQAVRLLYSFRRRVVLSPPYVREVDERTQS